MTRRAFSIAEVLVAAGIGLALMALGLRLFLQIGAATLSGSSQLELQLSTRETLRRLVPYLKMATPPNSQQTAVYAPDIGQTAGNVVFCSPEDVFDASPPAFDPRNPSYILLQVRWDTATQKLILEDFYNPTRNSILARKVSKFRVTRSHRIGLRIEVERQTLSRDLRGNPKTVRFELSDTLQLPE
ncbi:hypothetical protein IV102_33165 [bacterium]|nr:hypothetical protein [bacterium]